MRLGAVKVEAICSQYRPENWLMLSSGLEEAMEIGRIPHRYTAITLFFRKGIKGFSLSAPAKSTMSEETAQKYEEAEKRDGILPLRTNISLFFIN